MFIFIAHVQWWFSIRFAKMCPKKVELHRSLKINCDHFITLQLSIKISTSNISTVYFAEVS